MPEQKLKFSLKLKLFLLPLLVVGGILVLEPAGRADDECLGGCVAQRDSCNAQATTNRQSCDMWVDYEFNACQADAWDGYMYCMSTCSNSTCSMYCGDGYEAALGSCNFQSATGYNTCEGSYGSDQSWCSLQYDNCVSGCGN